MKYKVGTSNDGSTLFFLTDWDGLTYNAKKIKYIGINRDKSRTTLHIRTYAQGYTPNVLFGAHLLNRINIDNIINIGVVESEKTAIIATLESRTSFDLAQYTFVACGGKTNLTEEKAKRLKVCQSNKKKIYLFADADGQKEWVKLNELYRFDGVKLLSGQTGTMDLADLILLNKKPFAKPVIQEIVITDCVATNELMPSFRIADVNFEPKIEKLLDPYWIKIPPIDDQYYVPF